MALDTGIPAGTTVSLRHLCITTSGGAWELQIPAYMAGVRNKRKNSSFQDRTPAQDFISSSYGYVR